MPHSHHHPGREPSTTSASSSTSSKTSLSAARVIRANALPEQILPIAGQVRVPVTRIHPHHLHHHPRYGYLYPPLIDANGYPGIFSITNEFYT